jgi:glyoxylase-like metal-dependent hydrolase (beta-lactamase superfamily II)
VIGIGTQPGFAIGQRALILRTAGGNVLWDCISMIDAATVTLIDGLGGLKAIAISHPHFYTSMVEWSRAFGNVPIHLHAADQGWIVRPDAAINLWASDTLALLPSVTLIRCGGHFPGGTVLHWNKGTGILCSGDIAMVTTDRKFLSFMRSYPNFIPLSASAVEAIAAALAPFDFDTVYGLFFDRVLRGGAKTALGASVARHLAAIDAVGVNPPR